MHLRLGSITLPAGLDLHLPVNIVKGCGIRKETAISFAEYGAKGVMFPKINEDSAKAVAERSKQHATDPSSTILIIKVDVTNENRVDMVTSAIILWGPVNQLWLRDRKIRSHPMKFFLERQRERKRPLQMAIQRRSARMGQRYCSHGIFVEEIGWSAGDDACIAVGGAARAPTL